MGIREILAELLSSDTSGDQLDPVADSMGVNFFLTPSKLKACEKGEASDWLLHQYVFLKMLEEQGLATPVRDGFAICSEDAVRLDSDATELLGLPGAFPGSFCLSVEGTTFSDRFAVEIIPISEGGQSYSVYNIRGPFIVFSDSEFYRLSPAQFHAFVALQLYKDQTATQKSERQNLLLVARLQEAKAQGMAIDLSQFNEYQVDIAEAVGVAVVEQDDGSFVLVPSYGTVLDPVEINNRLHQVLESEGEASLRVGKHIVCLDEKSLKATQEIIANRRVKKEDVKAFLKTPSAFINAELVNLDIGFSLRVHGATEFKHGYFGETDESGISWFYSSGECIYTPALLEKLVETQEDLDNLKAQLDDAKYVGAQQIRIGGYVVDVSDREQVERVIKKIEHKLANPEPEAPGEKPETGEQEATAKVVVDIDLNDEQAGFALQDSIKDVSYAGNIDFAAYLFKPYSYQEAGIRWILGLAEHSLGIADDEVGKHGALLADDMGLGKTFMSLAAVREYQLLARQRDEAERPVLVVAPLSLLESWRDEVKAVYASGESPFNSLILLQAEGDLKRFKAAQGVETKQTVTGDGYDIRYALKIGKDYGVDRLDMERRLVLTTYETLRDYQFSLSVIDWSFVIFDEAQRIKNPNALWTRAAKALKARFKLLATGTPVENHLGDFWCLMDTARPGELGAYQQFRSEYIKPITSASDEDKAEVRLKVGTALRLAVGSSMLRRVKEDQLEGLPKKTIFSGYPEDSTVEYLELLACSMPPAQRQRYETVIGLVQEEQESEEKGNAVLAGLHRLQDVSLHPQLMDGGLLPMPANEKEARQIVAESGKLQQTFALLDQINSRREKVIIFAINKRLQSFLKIACEKVYGINVSIINGDTKAVAKKPNAATRKSLIKTFEAKEGFGVIIMSPVAAGMGLTVVGANNVIHIQRHWNPAKEAQATDRVYRIGQDRDVNVYLPILQHPEFTSFDVNLNKLLNQKCALKDAVVTPEDVNPTELGGGVFGGTVKPAEPDHITLNQLHLLSWEQFEAFVVELIAASVGGDPLLTKSGTDSGADGIVWSQKGNILIQAKHSESLRPVNEDASAQIYAAKPKYESSTDASFDRLIAITNAKGFSRRVQSAAKSYGVELMSLSDIKGLIKKYPVDRRVMMKRLGKSRLAI